MTPQQFQELALGWIAALGAIVLALVGTGFSIWAVIRAKTAEYQARVSQVQTEANTQRLDRHSETLRSQAKTIAEVALQTPPPKEDR